MRDSQPNVRKLPFKSWKSNRPRRRDGSLRPIGSVPGFDLRTPFHTSKRISDASSAIKTRIIRRFYLRDGISETSPTAGEQSRNGNVRLGARHNRSRPSQASDVGSILIARSINLSDCSYTAELLKNALRMAGFGRQLDAAGSNWTPKCVSDTSLIAAHSSFRGNQTVINAPLTLRHPFQLTPRSENPCLQGRTHACKT
jgi:hypothetical protein